jgi:hypothetical protein
VNSPNGAELLTNKVTEQVLLDIGQNNNLGDKLVNEYRQKFVKGYN